MAKVYLIWTNPTYRNICGWEDLRGQCQIRGRGFGRSKWRQQLERRHILESRSPEPFVLVDQSSSLKRRRFVKGGRRSGLHNYETPHLAISRPATEKKVYAVSAHNALALWSLPDLQISRSSINAYAKYECLSRNLESGERNEMHGPPRGCRICLPVLHGAAWVWRSYRMQEPWRPCFELSYSADCKGTSSSIHASVDDSIICEYTGRRGSWLNLRHVLHAYTTTAKRWRGLRAKAGQRGVSCHQRRSLERPTMRCRVRSLLVDSRFAPPCS